MTDFLDLIKGWFTPTVRAILQGQFISILIAGTGIFATLLSDSHPNANFPFFMNFLNYFLLSFFLARRCERKKEEVVAITFVSFPDDPYESVGGQAAPPKAQKWWYFIAAILDVEANYLVLLAYNYTTITSVMLLDCFTIPCAMIFSYLFLGCRYTPRHYLGAVICLSGLICIVIDDSISGGGEAGSNPVVGDLLCLCGAVLYAASNVFQESLVKYYDRDDFRGHLGVFGMLIAGIQCLALDLPSMMRANYNVTVVLSILGFVGCLNLMYVNTSAFLQDSDATVFNLSLLTSDVYAVLFAYFAEHYLVHYLYFLAFVLVLIGLACYHSEHPPLQVGQEQNSGLHPLIARCLARFSSLTLRPEGKSFLGSGSVNTGNRPSQRRFEYNPINSQSSSHGETVHEAEGMDDHDLRSDTQLSPNGMMVTNRV